MKKYPVLTPEQQAEVTFGLCAAVTASVMDNFPPHQRHKRVYRELQRLNKQLSGLLEAMEYTGVVDRLGISGELADRFNEILVELGLVEEDHQNNEESSAT